MEAMKKQFINFKEIPFARPMVDEAGKKAVMDVLNGHILTHGPNCKLFETVFSEFVGGGNSVSVSSCMAALHLSTIYFGFGPGDEVLVPAQTHVATVHAVELTGATPVFVDCELETGNIDLELLEAVITPKTKGIILVHFAGIPVNMEKVMEIAHTHNLKVIEDCALAVGARYNGKHVGLFGDTGCFSFYPVKHITSGEGGMLVSKDEIIANQIAHFRAFSVDRDHTTRDIPGMYNVTGVGLNYRMSELQAALGASQVKKIPDFLKKRSDNFKALKQALLDVSPQFQILDASDPKANNSHYCLVLMLRGDLGKKRTEIINKLKEKGVGTSIYYPRPVAHMDYYKWKYGYTENDFPMAAKISYQSIALPVGPHLTTEDMAYIAAQLKTVIGEL